MNSNPVVSVICVCYNHERFVKAAIQSVFNQFYKNVELIVIDDGSTDNSVNVIKETGARLIALPKNIGYCAAFNEAFRVSKGDFIIDLAADDILGPSRIEIGVSGFLQHDDSFGVQYGDAEYINENGSGLGYHSSKFDCCRDGDVYTDLVRRYFICSPTMMIRRSVLTMLNGYDESLAYEDFDFWIRSSRHFKYFYTSQVLVQKRIVKGSMSDLQFRKGSLQQLSTFKVCEKIRALNRTKEENKALKERLWYEIRQAIRRMDLALAAKYFQLVRNA